MHLRLLALAIAGLLLCTSTSHAITVRGTGNAALVGNDLTDLGNNGVEAQYNPTGTPLTYNIQNIHMAVNGSINYGSGATGQFGTDNLYSTISGGAGLGGDDFSVRAQAFLRFNNAGTYSIGAGSDDGRLVDLSLVSGTYSGITSTGGQLSGGLTTPTSFGFDGTTGHNTSGGVFTVTAGTVLKLDSFFFERGSGDSFEVSVKSGSDTTPGGPGDGWVLLSQGALAGLDVSTNALFSDTNLTVKAYNIVTGGGANDEDLNTTTETRAIWTAIDNGQGTGALNFPRPATLAGFDATFFASSEASFGAGEAAFNVFDNQTGGGDNKWCCQGVSEATDGSGQSVGANFGGQAYILNRFTLTSSNDTPGRDPDVWAIQGSNDGVNWTNIYSFVATGDGTAGVAGLWGTTRNQVLEFSVLNGDFAAPGAFTQFRLFVDSVAGSGAFALAEIELFGTAFVPEPATATLALLGLGGLLMRRRRAA